MKYYNLSFSLKLYGMLYIKRNQSLGRQSEKKRTRHIDTIHHTPEQQIQTKSERSSERRRVIERSKIQSKEIESMTYYLHLNGIAVLFGLLQEKRTKKMK